jgi:hypothetical protein
MNIVRLAILVLLPALAAAAGCTSIHSGAVRDLIAIQGRKIDEATAGSKRVQVETDARIAAIRQARANLDQALKQQQASEHVHALVFSSNQNLPAQTDTHAFALAYLVSQVYLADGGGLDEKTSAQFDQDLDALADVAARLNSSWAALKKTQDSLGAYAAKSGLASVDADLVTAVIEQVPGTSEKADTALRAAKKLNDALDQVSGGPALRSGLFGRGRAINTDLIDLLERVKK